MNSADIVRAFWAAMRSNDFDRAARTWLAPDYIGLWPQTGEVIRGPGKYAEINRAFPGGGTWEFEEFSLVDAGLRVVTDMRISNNPLEVSIHAITFHEIRGEQILRQTEYWPDSYPVPTWRSGILEVDRKVSQW
ncbi:MAG TPA: nuclear transport factor 2 family protein [Paracoccus sp. (in: a-proteobacteria)]|uniref:nuclear transport factor 2 family protein n=1 Tax=uncultured Paracoccus sp. TaxID=189685 RepID=UPI002633C2C9|nr:nuclear transport factor 2 family protein [uncultured Paracoccus sp.]HMQ41864.1 nuclear transport factor 2 family protein [Paracoccus sp. (in: a-proteobacteria)]HMR35664.1 nuclear transport factor 2 family protein [Paracoccus sp. (in: a-proteobacteria)]